jgi:hypothetical protein
MPQLTPLASLPNTIVAWDFNVKHTDWYTLNPHIARSISLTTQFETMLTLNNTDEHTHVPHQVGYNNTLSDITFCSHTLSHTTTWRTVHDLPSDHLPIIITVNTPHDPPANNKTTYTNFKRADWESFTLETEQHFNKHNRTPITDINKTIESFNNIIQKIHSQGQHQKKYNPNFTR